MKKARTKKRIIKKKPVKKRVVKKSRKKKPVRKKPARKKIIRKKPIKKKRVIKKRRIVKKRKPIKKVKKRAVKKKKIIKRKSRKKIVRRRKRKKAIVRRTYSIGGPLEQLFESPVKVQIMKLFFRNPEENFLLKEAAKIMRMNLAMAREQMKRLEKVGLLKSRRISSRKQLFAINPNFDFFNELRELILRASPVSKEKMLKAIKGLGKIKLVLLSGLFVGNSTARADLLIVGDNINQRKLNTFIKNLEAEAGTDISCVAMTIEEFNYRYDMYDRFVRDLLNEKCEFLVNRLGL